MLLIKAEQTSKLARIDTLRLLMQQQGQTVIDAAIFASETIKLEGELVKIFVECDRAKQVALMAPLAVPKEVKNLLMTF